MPQRSKDYQGLTPASFVSDDDDDDSHGVGEQQDPLSKENNDDGPVWEIPDPVDPKQTLLLPPSGIYFTNSRGNQIHVRCYIPKEDEIKAVVFFAHGYSAHVNRRWCMERLFELLKSRSIAVIAHDHENHGYSGGSKRMHVSNIQHLVDDWMGIIDGARCGDVETFSQIFRGAKGIVTDDGMASQLAKAPYFLMGMSMGGLITQLTFQRLKRQQQQDPSYRLPSGLTFLCPLLSLPVRVYPILFWIIFVLTYCLHGLAVPELLTGGLDERDLVSTLDGRRRMHIDLTCGLGSKEGITLGTVLAFVHALSQVRLKETARDFPVIAFHDPQDVFVPYQCTEDLVAASRGAGDTTTKCTKVEVVPCPDQAHNLLHSRDSDVMEFVDRCEKWMCRSLAS